MHSEILYFSIHFAVALVVLPNLMVRSTWSSAEGGRKSRRRGWGTTGIPRAVAWPPAA